MRTSLLVGLALVAGCKKDGSGGGAVHHVACAPGAVSGATVVTWRTDLVGTATVRYGPQEDDLAGESPGVPAADGEEVVVGLGTAADSFLQVVVTDDGGREHRSDVVACTTAPPPPTAPAFTVTAWEPDLACEDGGYVLVSTQGDHESGVAILDREGRTVWAVESDAVVQYSRARLGRDGRSILWNASAFDRDVDLATIERTSLDGLRTTSTRASMGHDFVELPDGTLGWATYTFTNSDYLLGLGLDLAALGFPVDGPADWDDLQIAYDVILEAPEGTTDAPTVAWDQLRDWPEGVSWNDQAGCDLYLPGACELGHANALAWYEGSDRYAIGLSWLDAIVTTDRSGEVAFVLGGAAGTLTGDAADLPLHAHFSDVWDGGMLVFDNHDPDDSRLVQYAIDEVAGTYEATWTYQGDRNEPIGAVRRIPVEGCDNVLVSWSSDGRLEELTRDGRTVWEVSLGLGTITGRPQYLSSLTGFADQAYPE